ncbi:hypothetical protein niasHT_020331 [Heterodera trifolii]|uniref:Transmembrane protein n=1 Tax=Heterodera trifolii TaxID=157864 RepID=A0ABD2K4M7_9BILA
MVSIVWEMKSICGVPCPSPNNCWEPLEFTQPNLCLAPSINPNNFENHLSLNEASLVMLGVFLFIGGFALGALFGFLPLCCDFFWARRKRRRFVKIIHFLSFLITCCRCQRPIVLKRLGALFAPLMSPFLCRLSTEFRPFSANCWSVGKEMP